MLVWESGKTGGGSGAQTTQVVLQEGNEHISSILSHVFELSFEDMRDRMFEDGANNNGRLTKYNLSLFGSDSWKKHTETEKRGEATLCIIHFFKKGQHSPPSKWQKKKAISLRVVGTTLIVYIKHHEC